MISKLYNFFFYIGTCFIFYIAVLFPLVSMCSWMYNGITQTQLHKLNAVMALRAVGMIIPPGIEKEIIDGKR